MAIPPISPLVRTSPTFKEDLDAFFLTEFPATVEAFNTEIERINGTFDASFSTTSATSILVGTGTKTMTVEPAKSFAEGQNLLVWAVGNTAYMMGRITEYNRATGALTINSATTSGSGTYTSWAVSVAPESVGGNITVVDLDAAHTAVIADVAHLLRCTGTWALTLDDSASLMSGWWVEVLNAGTGAITLQCTAGQLVDGLSSYVIYPGEHRRIICDGAAFSSNIIKPMSATFTTSGTMTKPPGYRGFDFRIVNRGDDGMLWLRQTVGSLTPLIPTMIFSPYHPLLDGGTVGLAETEIATISGGAGGSYREGSMVAARMPSTITLVVGANSYIVDSGTTTGTVTYTSNGGAAGSGASPAGGAATYGGAGGGGLLLEAAGLQNWNFAAATGWTLGSGWSVTGGALVATGVSSGTVTQSVTTTVGQRYLAECMFESTTILGSNIKGKIAFGTATAEAGIAAGYNGARTVVGVDFVATGTSHTLTLSITGGSFTGKVEFVRLNKVTSTAAGGASTGAGSGGASSLSTGATTAGGVPGGGGGAVFKGDPINHQGGGGGQITLKGVL